MASTEAAKAASRKWYHENKDRAKAVKARYYLEHKEQCAKQSREWKEKNKELVRAWGRRDWRKYNKPEVQALWRANNAEKLRKRARDRFASEENLRAYNRLKSSRRRAAKCAWSDDDKMLAFYVLAGELSRSTGIKHVVDHVIPITHKFVCGLHNEFNLRVMTRHDNAVKKNRFEIV